LVGVPDFAPRISGRDFGGCPGFRVGILVGVPDFARISPPGFRVGILVGVPDFAPRISGRDFGGCPGFRVGILVGVPDFAPDFAIGDLTAQLGAERVALAGQLYARRAHPSPRSLKVFFKLP